MNDVAVADAPVAPPIPMVEFNVNLGTGRMAIVVLPAGMTAVEMLNLIGQMPGLGSQASMTGKSALDRILVPRR